MNHSYLTNPEIDLESLIIDTPRTTIEPFRIEGIDFEDLTKAFCEANENLYISPFLPSVEEERDFIASTIENRQNNKALECYVFNAISKELIGSVGISDLDTPEPNLGLWIRKEYHGKGYGTEVYAAMLNWVKKETNFSFFKHTVNPKNIPSIRLAEKFNGKIQGALTKKGELKYYIPTREA